MCGGWGWDVGVCVETARRSSTFVWPDQVTCIIGVSYPLPVSRPISYVCESSVDSPSSVQEQVAALYKVSEQLLRKERLCFPCWSHPPYHELYRHTSSSHHCHPPHHPLRPVVVDIILLSPEVIVVITFSRLLPWSRNLLSLGILLKLMGSTSSMKAVYVFVIIVPTVQLLTLPARYWPLSFPRVLESLISGKCNSVPGIIRL